VYTGRNNTCLGFAKFARNFGSCLQPREFVKVQKVADHLCSSARTAFSISSLTANYQSASSNKSVVKDIAWKKPSRDA
jgi:hypothetical protein